MHLTQNQRNLIEQTINVFETGKAQGQYGAVSLYKDGPFVATVGANGVIKKVQVKQVTYGRAQTTEFGNLRELLQKYVSAGGVCSRACAPYLDRIGDLAHPLCEDAAFIALLKTAGKDPVMHTVQNQFFEDVYFVPAMDWASRHGFTLALSALVIYDSYIHSGRIRQELRNQFAERPPSLGGSEQAWIKVYVTARHKWLSNHTNEVVKKSNYRTRDLLGLIEAKNWTLDQLPIKIHGVQIS